MKILNKIPQERDLHKNILGYVPAVYYSTHTARPFLLRGPQRGWEARGQLWRDVEGREEREKGGESRVFERAERGSGHGRGPASWWGNKGTPMNV